MKVLIVAMAESIHIARWISQISDQRWDIHLFPSIDYGRVHPELKNVTVYHSIYGRQKEKLSNIKFNGIPVISRGLAHIGRFIINELIPDYRSIQLWRVIKKLKPDIIHSIEIQNAGYLTLKVKKSFKGNFPPWIITNYGSDIYLFGRLKEHEEKIKEVLSQADFYSCESQRDIELAKLYGFKGKTLPVFPNTGGFDLKLISNLRQSGFVSERRIIMLKGYQGWAGRALVGLRAIERCADILKRYEIVMYGAAPEVLIAAELFEKSTNVPVKIIPQGATHEKILSYHGKARISIGLSISDAISTSFLEALAMGSFPIQSHTSTANEWIENGKTGILVPPDDPDIIETAIRRALSDDDLVNNAAEINYKTVKERLDENIIKPKVVEFYKSVLEV